MHQSSIGNMIRFINKYLKRKGTVLDVGSMDINGTYKELFDGWNYTGIDIAPGKNVDKVVEPYDWKFRKRFDVIISGQALEHIEDDKAAVKEMFKCLDIKGFCCIIVPSTGPKHGYPDDYRRYTKESLCELMESVGFTIVEAYLDNTSNLWNDVVAIARKGEK